MEKTDDVEIGYSAYETAEEYYEYVENSCFIAESPEKLVEFTENCWNPAENYRKKVVRFSDMLNDYGVSGRSFAIEKGALKRFEKEAEKRGIKYQTEPYPGFDKSSELFYLKISMAKKRNAD
jgi:hypothetical protein